jgi:hypothetical protein
LDRYGLPDVVKVDGHRLGFARRRLIDVHRLALVAQLAAGVGRHQHDFTWPRPAWYLPGLPLRLGYRRRLGPLCRVAQLTFDVLAFAQKQRLGGGDRRDSASHDCG